MLSVIFLVAPLGGCGGGGASGAQAADRATVSASSDGTSNTTTTTTTNTPGGTTTPTPTTTGNTTPTPVPVPGGPTTQGSGVFSGKITDEKGDGLSAVSLNAAPISTTGKVLNAQGPAGTTDDQGNFRIPGFNTDQAYALTISRQDRKTLRTVFTVDPNSPDVSMLLIAPKGTGLVEFTMPTVLKLKAVTTSTTTWDTMFALDPATIQFQTKLTWDVSPNPGFLSYVVYAGDQPNMGLKATQLDAIFAPGTVQSLQTTNSTAKKYYRVYEKMFIPELGTFLLSGTNEVASSIPTATLASPTSATNVARSTPIHIDCSAGSDPSQVQVRVVEVTGQSPSTSKARQELPGSVTVSGNRVTFTPQRPLPGGRTIIVNATNAVDADGNKNNCNSFSFKTAQGLVLDGAFASTPLGSLPSPSFTYQGQIAVDNQNEILIPCRGLTGTGTFDQFRRYDVSGNLIDTIVVNLYSGFPNFIYFTPDDKIWFGYPDVSTLGTKPSFTSITGASFGKTTFPVPGLVQVIPDFSTGTASQYPIWFCVDPTQPRFYYTSHNISTSGGTTIYRFDSNGHMSLSKGNCMTATTDTSGNLYTEYEGTPGDFRLVKMNSQFTVQNSTPSLGAIIGGDHFAFRGIGTGKDNTIYTVEVDWADQSRVYFTQYDSNLQIINGGDVDISLFSDYDVQIAIDQQGRIYTYSTTQKVRRFVPVP